MNPLPGEAVASVMADPDTPIRRRPVITPEPVASGLWHRNLRLVVQQELGGHGRHRDPSREGLLLFVTKHAGLAVEHWDQHWLSRVLDRRQPCIVAGLADDTDL